jgi:phosphoglucomutase
VNRPDKPNFIVKIIDPCTNYIKLMEELFDFKLLKELFARPDFYFSFDGLHGVSGPYAKTIFHQLLGCKL